jgi:hypothetical protein
MFKFAVQRKMYEHFRDRLKLDQRLHFKTANKKNQNSENMRTYSTARKQKEYHLPIKRQFS